MQNNPLRKYFRQPAIYIKLPSNGNFYEPGTLDMPPNRELPVFPMTAMDEITYRTPDALFNGQAVINVIQSCVPSVRDASKIPSCDLNTLLVAIRIASYGHEMSLGSVCPKCGTDHEYTIDLRTVLDSFKSPDFETPLVAGDLTIYFTPLTYKQLNEISKIQFEDQKLIEMIPNADLPEDEKLRRLNQAFLKLSTMTLNALSESISMIKTDSEIVTEPEFIKEFVANCSRDMFDKIRDRIVSLKEQSELKPLKIHCLNPECQKDYETPFTLDVSNFFASAS